MARQRRLAVGGAAPGTRARAELGPRREAVEDPGRYTCDALRAIATAAPRANHRREPRPVRRAGARAMGGLFSGLMKGFHEGGPGMYPIAAAMVFALAIIAERIWVLYFKASIDKHEFVRGLKKHLYAGDLDKAIGYCAGQKKTPLVAVVKAGLIQVPRGEEDVQAAMDEATLREAPLIERRTGYLAMIANVATLLGLLGTIVGLIGAFAAVANANPADKATMLSSSISEAMNCTAFGLGVAIVALVCWSILQGRTQSMVDDVNETAVSVLNLVVANRDKMKMPSAPANAPLAAVGAE
jgi:biopolymer transport protein ExbB/TolQ